MATHPGVTVLKWMLSANSSRSAMEPGVPINIGYDTEEEARTAAIAELARIRQLKLFAEYDEIWVESPEGAYYRLLPTEKKD